MTKLVTKPDLRRLRRDERCHVLTDVPLTGSEKVVLKFALRLCESRRLRSADKRKFSAVIAELENMLIDTIRSATDHMNDLIAEAE